MPCKDPLRKALDKLLNEDGIMGYQVKGEEVILFVESDEVARSLAIKEIQGHRITVRVSGRFEAL